MNLVVAKGNDGIRPAVCTAPINEITTEIPMASHACFDIAKAFFQIRVKEDQAKLQVVWLPHISRQDIDEWKQNKKIADKGVPPRMDKYQINSVIQGCPNGSAVCQAKIDKLTIDDVLLSTRSVEEHRREVHKFLRTCQVLGTRLSRKKCVILTDRAKVLSHEVYGSELAPSAAFAASIPTNPTNKVLLRLSQSLAYFSKLIPEFTLRTQPIRDYASTKPNEIASNENVATIRRIIEDLPTISVNRIPTNEALTLITDFSKTGKCALLCTEDKKLIRAFSEPNSTWEQAMSSPDGEICAGIAALTKMEKLLRGRKIKWISDSAALVLAIRKYVKTGTPSDFIARRIMKLLDFQIEIQHESGETIPADWLSRFIPSYSEQLLVNALTQGIQNQPEMGRAQYLHNLWHPGKQKFRRLLKSEGISLSKEQITKLYQDCDGCQKARSLPVHLPYKHTSLAPEYRKSATAYAMDSASIGNKKSILVRQDLWNKTIACRVVHGPVNSKIVAEFIPPTTKYLRSDQGSEFGRFVNDKCKALGIERAFSPPHHKCANGHAESCVKLIKTRLRASDLSSKNDVPTLQAKVDTICSGHATEIHSTTKYAPIDCPPSEDLVPEDRRWTPRALPDIEPNVQTGDWVYILKKPLPKAGNGWSIDLETYYKKKPARIAEIHGAAVILEGPCLDLIGTELLRKPATPFERGDIVQHTCTSSPLPEPATTGKRIYDGGQAGANTRRKFRTGPDTSEN